jgi:hypothetical protein
MAEKEIGAARRSSSGSSGVPALHTREREGDWCGVKRRWCSFFIGQRGKGRRRGEAVAVARRRRSLMAATAALWRGRRGREARVSEKRGETEALARFI